MTEVEIANALQQRLAGLAGAPPIIWENKSAVPVPPCLVAEVVRVSAVEDALAGGQVRRRGFLMVSVFSSLDAFATAGLTQADAIAARFPFGLRLTAGAGVVVIRQAPEVLQGERDGPVWRTPVRIPYEAF